MTRIAHLDPIGGLAGDMLLAALIDVGAPRGTLDDSIAALGLNGIDIEISHPVRGGLRSTHVAVLAAGLYVTSKTCPGVTEPAVEL